MNLRQSTGALLSAAFLACAATPAAAAEPPRPTDAPKSDWRFTVGAGVGLFPDYEGSDDFDPLPLPVVDISYRDIVSIGSVGGPGLKLKLLKIQGPTPGDKLKVTLKFGYGGGRDQDDNDALGGLGDLDGGANVKLKAEYGIRGFTTFASLARDLTGDREGMAASFGVGYGLAFNNNKTMLSVGPSVTWADDDYMQNSFGITAAQATASTLGLARHTAEAGLKDVGFSIMLRHGFTRRIGLTAQASVSRLLGDAADSPLVNGQGSATQFSFLTGIAYTW